MGTRSTYRIIKQWEDEGKKGQDELCLIYLQYDGYPSGHPLQVAEFLSKGKVVNGLGYNQPELLFNGAGCLAAQLIKELKDGAGGTYILTLSSRGNSWEDYLYDIIVKPDSSIEFVAYRNGKTIYELFRGTPEQFIKEYKKEPEYSAK